MKENNKNLKIAIVGTGISGLTSAYILNKRHDITIYEKNNYIGGHTHTHKIKDKNQSFNIDSGFIVYNENTYPNFIKLLDIINVKRQHTDMGFSVKSSKLDFEYAGIDDLAKLTTDFMLAPSVPITADQSYVFREYLMRHADLDYNFSKRVDILYPIAQVKWICIILSYFN